MILKSQRLLKLKYPKCFLPLEKLWVKERVFPTRLSRPEMYEWFMKIYKD